MEESVIILLPIWDTFRDIRLFGISHQVFSFHVCSCSAQNLNDSPNHLLLSFITAHILQTYAWRFTVCSCYQSRERYSSILFLCFDSDFIWKFSSRVNEKMEGGYKPWRTQTIVNNSPDLDSYGRPLPPPPSGYYWERRDDLSWELMRCNFFFQLSTQADNLKLATACLTTLLFMHFTQIWAHWYP